MRPVFKGRNGTWLTAAVILFVMAAVVSGYYHIENSNLSEDMKSERLHAETLFSNKVVLQKEMEGLRREIIRLEFEGKTSKAELDRLKKLLSEGEAILFNKKKAVTELSESLGDARLQEQAQAAKLQEMSEAIDALQGENDQMRQEIAEFRQSELAYRSELESLRKPKATYFRIEALKGRSAKETNKASKTRRMLVSFTWPEAAHNKRLYLVLSGPDDKVIGDPSKEQVSILLDGTYQLITPTVTREINIIGDSQRQEVVLEVPHKLQPGIYQADVYTNDFHLGGTQIRLE